MTTTLVRIAAALSLIAGSALIGTTITPAVNLTSQRQPGSPMPVMEWQDILDAGQVAIGGSGRITDPTSDTNFVSTHVLDLGKVSGTYIAVRLKYDDGLSAVTSPVVALFGRVGDSGQWMRLSAVGGSDTITLVVDTTNDMTDGTYKYTAVNTTAQVFDRMGCDQFGVGVETALDGTGTKTNAVVQAKGL